MIRAIVCALLVSAVAADMYLHNPRGSNNRLNEANAERNNGNRMFDSQNNNRGGYNVGDKTQTAATDTTNYGLPSQIYDETQASPGASLATGSSQYPMVYYEQSILQIEWTNQHGCGGNALDDPTLQNCNIVLQYACDNANNDPALAMTMRDGTDSNNQPGTDGTTVNQGQHESADYYYECTTRLRNKGLFLADQNLNGNTAIYTRQNNGGGRSGLECSEERDYYPYWLPTPFVDIAYLTDRLDFCTPPAGSPSGTLSYIAANSQNSATKYKCASTLNAALNPPITGVTTATQTLLSSQDAVTCATNGGRWLLVTWGLPAPACIQAPWTRSNHLGNARNGTQMPSYNWTLPAFTDLQSIGATIYDTNYVKCIVRIRYNISTDDYDPWNTNVTSSTSAGGTSPVTTNTQVNIGADLQSLQLAINTNQFGRTFQDRSHIFYIRQLPSALSTAVSTGSKIWNVNVRGKRGNIVQVYPAIEYDFVPNRLHIRQSTDFVHLQWTGSNTHNNGGGGGDGQTGSDGEGTGGTDRSNFVQINDMSQNYPIPLDKFASTNIFANSNCYKLDGTTVGTAQAGTTNIDCAVWLATSGYFRTGASVIGAVTTNGGTTNDAVSPTLDNAPPSLIGGLVMKVNTPGQFNYASSRNNNFSNRSQKATLMVDAVSN